MSCWSAWSGYLRTLCDYIHLNPVRAKLIKADRPLRQYRWSSYPEKAEGIVRQGLKGLRWHETDLEERPKGDRRKVLLALKLRQQATMSLKWVAKRLNMGTWEHGPICRIFSRSSGGERGNP